MPHPAQPAAHAAGSAIADGDAWAHLQAQGGGEGGPTTIILADDGLEVSVSDESIVVAIDAGEVVVAVENNEIAVSVNQSPLEVEV